MILTVDELRQFVTTTLVDDALQTLADAAEAAITERLGAAGERSELVHGGFRTVALGRPADTISAVTETIGTTTTTLSADDYRLWPDGYTLERLSTGTNPRWNWWGLIEVTYSPVNDAALRAEVQIDLMKLAITYNPGLSQQTIGTWSESYSSHSVWNNAEERETILARLHQSPGLVVVGNARWGSTW